MDAIEYLEKENEKLRKQLQSALSMIEHKCYNCTYDSRFEFEKPKICKECRDGKYPSNWEWNERL